MLYEPSRRPRTQTQQNEEMTGGGMVVIFFLLTIIAFPLGYFVGDSLGQKEMEKAAIAAGAGYYETTVAPNGTPIYTFKFIAKTK